jgi:hypothetical protein
MGREHYHAYDGHEELELAAIGRRNVVAMALGRSPWINNNFVVQRCVPVCQYEYQSVRTSWGSILEAMPAHTMHCDHVGYLVRLLPTLSQIASCAHTCAGPYFVSSMSEKGKQSHMCGCIPLNATGQFIAGDADKQVQPLKRTRGTGRHRLRICTQS